MTIESVGRVAIQTRVVCIAVRSGPRLQAIVALLGGLYRPSKRRTAAFLSDRLGVAISSGMFSKAQRIDSESLATPVERIEHQIGSAPGLGLMRPAGSRRERSPGSGWR